MLLAYTVVIIFEEGSSEASASDAKSVSVDVDELHKLIKQTVHEDLATEKPSASSILKSRSKGSFNLIVSIHAIEVSASMLLPKRQYCYIV